MNKEVVETLLKRAGFEFWGNESWGPGPGNIDWACKYDKEIWEFARLLTEEHKQTLIDNDFADAAEYL